ncbi:MAG: PAS domain S-box protein [Pseudomonadota bacterium]
MNENDLLKEIDGLRSRVAELEAVQVRLRETEENLRRSREQLQTIFETSPAGIVLVNPEGLITIANKKMGDLFSMPWEDLPGTPYVDLVHPEHRFIGHAKMTALMSGEIDHVSLERRYRAADGREFLGHLSGRRIFKEDGTLEGLVGIIMDITERKKAEDALKAGEKKFRQLAEVTFEGIIFHDKGILLEANDQFYSIMGYEPDELIGTDVIEKTISPESLKTVRDHVASGSTEPYEIVGLRKDGTEIPLEVRVKLQRTGDKEIRAVALRDVSERKEMERQLIEAQKMEAVGTLAAGVAHDFNNLLHIIAGNAELLEMDLAEQGMRFPETDAIRHSTERGADLVKQILTFSRKIGAEFEYIDINEDIKRTERLLSRTLPKMIDIELSLERKLKTIRADSAQIEQLLINLAANAADAMPEGGRLIIETDTVRLDDQFCRTHKECRPGEYVRLRVEDTGHGMSEEVLQHIFEPFFTTKGLADGTGLGLATVFGIVKMHGGHIACGSEAGTGTAFVMHFPVAEAGPPDIRAKHEDTDPARGCETILVVDDEPLIADLAKRILENAGYSVITARDGKEALAAYSQEGERIALVILDLIMPEMGGKQCLEELLKIDPGVKTLIVSGHASKGTTLRCKNSGAESRVDKPFNTRDLLRSVRRVLDGK